MFAPNVFLYLKANKKKNIYREFSFYKRNIYSIFLYLDIFNTYIKRLLLFV